MKKILTEVAWTFGFSVAGLRESRKRKSIMVDWREGKMEVARDLLRQFVGRNLPRKWRFEIGQIIARAIRAYGKDYSSPPLATGTEQREAA